MQRRQKNFRLDIFARRIIMKIARDAAVSAVSPHTSNSRTMLTAWVAARRSTRFWGYVDHDRKDHDEAYRETQGSRPAPVSHLHHPLRKGVANRRNTTASLRRLYHTAQKSQALPIGRACCVYRLIAPSALCASASRGAHSDRKRSTCCAQRPV